MDDESVNGTRVVQLQSGLKSKAGDASMGEPILARVDDGWLD